MGEENQAAQQTWESNPTVNRLAALVGAWCTEILMPADPPIDVRGQATVEWLKEGPFLLMRSSVEHQDFPIGTMIIGGDDSSERYSMLYFDSRGIARIYEMSLSDAVWELRRESPGFSQRFIGKFSDNGNTITGYWEKSTDGSSWEHDFDLTYRRENHGRK